MTPKEKAEKLYKDAYMRWCYELSHDKNNLTAKDISIYVCNRIIDAIDWHEFETPNKELNYWLDVRKEIEKL